MVKDVRSPRPVKGNQAPSINGSAEHVLGDEFSLGPSDNLFSLASGMLALSDIHKPLVICIVPRSPVFEPFVDEHIWAPVN